MVVQQFVDTAYCFKFLAHHCITAINYKNKFNNIVHNKTSKSKRLQFPAALFYIFCLFSWSISDGQLYTKQWLVKLIQGFVDFKNIIYSVKDIILNNNIHFTGIGKCISRTFQQMLCFFIGQFQ